jgi:hypothetical protein
MLGLSLSLPVLLAPIGYSRLMHIDGEAGAAAAAGDAGTAYILSTISGHRLEDVRTGSKGPVFYQLYLMGGREAAEAIINRAQDAGCSALVVTVDTALAGVRERDFRNGMKQLMGNGIFAKIPYLPALLASFLLDGGVPPTSPCGASWGRSDADDRGSRRLGSQHCYLGGLSPGFVNSRRAPSWPRAC